MTDASRTLQVEDMVVHVHRGIDELAASAADEAARHIAEAVGARGTANVMFATGNSQIAFIDALTARDDVPWSRVEVLHMDEYVGIPERHPASFRRWITERITQRVHPRAAHYIDGNANAEEVCARYADVIHTHPLDLCCLGIGENGHLAFNDPPFCDFDDPLDVKVVTLDEASRRQQVGEGHFADLESVPKEAITVTIPALLRAGWVLAVVPEARKADAVREAVNGPVSCSCPASVLRTRKNVSLHLDEKSGSQIRPLSSPRASRRNVAAQRKRSRNS